MDLFALVVIVYIIYLLTWFVIVCVSDSDFITFFATRFGKTPENAFSGKVVWVTGASSGIGESLAKLLAQSNARLVISARRKDELLRVKKECLALNPKLKERDILVLDFDMLDYSAHQSTLENVLSHFGELDTLISNAGRSQRADWHEIDLQVDRDMFEINVFSLLNLNRIVVRHFFKVGGGSLAVTSSLAGILGAPGCGSYAGAKHALHGYFECLRNETRDKNISITMLCPGPVHSDIRLQSLTTKSGEKCNEAYDPSSKRMTSERCAYLCLVAIANKLDESWMALFPMMLVTYTVLNHSYLISKVVGLVNIKSFVLKVRGARESSKEQ